MQRQVQTQLLVQQTLENGTEGEKQFLYFPSGILGFEEVQDYVILDDDETGSPLKWMQAVSNPDLAFVIIDPLLFMPSYDIDIDAAILDDLGAEDSRALALFVLITIPHDRPAKMTANLQGPVVVNMANGWAKQLVLSQSIYHTQYPLFPSSG